MNDCINEGGPAFPTENDHQTGPNTYHYSGMTLRDYIAAKALQGIITAFFTNPDAMAVSSAAFKSKGLETGAGVAMTAYEFADAMLAAREKGVK